MTICRPLIGAILPESVSVYRDVMLICQSRPESQVRPLSGFCNRGFRATKPVSTYHSCGERDPRFCSLLLLETPPFFSSRTWTRTFALFILLIRARRRDMATPAPEMTPAAKRTGSLPLRSRSGCLTCRTKHVR